MLFDLTSLIVPINGLESLSTPFTCEEIAEVVKSMSIDKSPGLMVLMDNSSRLAGKLLRRIFINYVVISMRGI
jgi:hypothetical protein